MPRRTAIVPRVFRPNINSVYMQLSYDTLLWSVTGMYLFFQTVPSVEEKSKTLFIGRFRPSVQQQQTAARHRKIDMPPLCEEGPKKPSLYSLTDDNKASCSCIWPCTISVPTHLQKAKTHTQSLPNAGLEPATFLTASQPAQYYTILLIGYAANC